MWQRYRVTTTTGCTLTYVAATEDQVRSFFTYDQNQMPADVRFRMGRLDRIDVMEGTDNHDGHR